MHERKSLLTFEVKIRDKEYPVQRKLELTGFDPGFYKAGGTGGAATRTFRFDDLFFLLITENVRLFTVNVRLFQQMSDFSQRISNFL